VVEVQRDLLYAQTLQDALPPWEACSWIEPADSTLGPTGGYYIRCRGNFRDSKVLAGPDYFLATAYCL